MNPGTNNTTFKIQFKKNLFNKEDILVVDSGKTQVQVLETPHRKWYKQLLQFITFGFCKAPWQYKVKLIE